MTGHADDGTLCRPVCDDMKAPLVKQLALQVTRKYNDERYKALSLGVLCSGKQCRGHL